MLDHDTRHKNGRNNRKYKSKFVKISDKAVRHYWTCKNDECSNHNIQTFYIYPDWYENNGTPVCPECDIDMKYLKTEVDYQKVIKHTLKQI